MTNEETKEFTYFLQPITCGNKLQSQTVHEWLDSFSITHEEEIIITWHQRVSEIGAILREVYKKFDINHDMINSMLFTLLYIDYDLGKDFTPQFVENSKIALDTVKKIQSKSRV